MKKHELLIPAGNMECLYQAVFHGADAVYLAGQSFGARKFASNFSNEELISAIKFCHLYGVKVFVTMNTLIKDDEVEEYIEQIRFLHKNNVDAVIVQDFGMICLLREMFPNLEIHASTQANNSSKNICELFYKLGVKRVVFSRELSIDEIDSIDVPIEKEAFIHGALCVSYSGCCLMSSMLGGRSGNRGECAGSCRLPYSLLYDGDVIKKGYLLSMKELNTSPKFERLLNSSVYSFKVEGRMKGPLYVGFITSFYRKLIDGCYICIEEEIEKLKTIFNREFTVGHMFGVNDSKIINNISPNHIGLKVGTSIAKKNKIKIYLDKGRMIHQNDAIRFLNSNKGMIVNYLYDKNMKLCSEASGECYVDNKIGMMKNDDVAITQSSLLEKEYILKSSNKKIPITFKIKAHESMNLEVSVSDGENKFNILGSKIEKALNAPISEEDIIKQFSKLGNTPFVLKDIDIDLSGDIFIQLKYLNEVRRELIDKLIDSREKKVIGPFVENKVLFEKYNDKVNKRISCLVHTENQLKKCLNSYDRIYVNSFPLYEQYKNEEKVYYFLDRCAYDYSNLPKRFISSDIFFFDSDYSIGSYQMNVFNIYTAYYLRKIGLSVIPLSVELQESEVIKLVSEFRKKFGYVEFELLKYGRIENMVIKGNILNLKKNSTNYILKDLKDRSFPVYYDGTLTHIYNYECVDINIDNLQDISLRYDFFEENFSNIVKQN